MIIQTTQANWYDYLLEVLEHIRVGKDAYWIEEAERRLVDSLYYYIDQSLPSWGLYMDGSVDMLCILDKIWDSCISQYDFLNAFYEFRRRILYGSFDCFDSRFEYRQGFFETQNIARRYFAEPIVKELISRYELLVERSEG